MAYPTSSTNTPVSGADVTISDSGGLFSGIVATANAFFQAVRTATVLKAGTELTIASGAVTVTQSVHTIDTESDAATDDLDTISGGEAGQFIRIAASNSGRVSRLRHGVGNIQHPLQMDVLLDGTNGWIELYKYDSSNWAVVGADGWITNKLSGAAASVTLTVPDAGTHLEVECIPRGDAASTTVNFLVTWNGDTTATNYAWQRGGGSNNTAVSAEGNSAAVGVVPGGTGVSGVFGWVRMVFPVFRDTDKVRTCFIQAIGEAAAENATVHIINYRRITAGSGALTDRISTIVISPGSSNWVAGSIFRFRVVR